MKLLTKDLKTKLPGIRATEAETDPMVLVKFFNPTGAGTWYGLEFDGTDLFFGYISGLGDDELGYFSLSELQAYKGKFGLGIERDLHFTPKLLSEVKASIEKFRN